MEMMHQKYSPNKKILVIDKQDFWLELSVKTLTDAGYSVRAETNYHSLAPIYHKRGTKPDLVIFGCAFIEWEELNLVASLHEEQIALLVLCTSLSWDMMREIYLAGADNVTEKPFSPEKLLSTVDNTFKTISRRERYRLKEKELEEIL